MWNNFYLYESIVFALLTSFMMCLHSTKYLSIYQMSGYSFKKIKQWFFDNYNKTFNFVLKCFFTCLAIIFIYEIFVLIFMP